MVFKWKVILVWPAPADAIFSGSSPRNLGQTKWFLAPKIVSTGLLFRFPVPALKFYIVAVCVPRIEKKHDLLLVFLNYCGYEPENWDSLFYADNFESDVSIFLYLNSIA